MKAMLPVIIVLIVGLGAGAGGAFFMLKGSAAHGEVTQEKKKAPKVPPQLVELEEKTVNLVDSHYLKAAVSLELVGEGKAEEFMKEHKPVLLDCMLDIMSRQSYSQLLKPDGRKKLKAVLVEGLNKRLEESGWEVEDVLFTDFVME